jgi:hypothetical protein
MSDGGDANDDLAVVDAVDDPLLASPGAVVPRQLEAQGLAHALRVVGEWTVAELDGGGGDGFRQVVFE